MTAKKFRKQLLLQDVKMDGSINFQTNGDINIYPCPWENDKQVTNGDRVNYKGGISVDADGHTRVKRYNIGAIQVPQEVWAGTYQNFLRGRDRPDFVLS